MRHEYTVARGTSIRGKKTLDTRSRLDTSEPWALPMIPLNRFQASSPTKLNTRAATPPVFNPATRPNTRAKISAVSRGCNTTQTTPSSVWR